MSLPITGLFVGLLLAIAAAIGGWSAFALAVFLGVIGYLVGAQISGRLNLLDALSGRGRG